MKPAPDNITYGPKIHGITDKKELNETVEDLCSRRPFGRGGRQARQIGSGTVRRTTAETVHRKGTFHQPGIILMDEPTSALDPIATSKIEDLACESQKDYTVVIVTHNMQQASRISDKTGFMYLGKMIELTIRRRSSTNRRKRPPRDTSREGSG